MQMEMQSSKQENKRGLSTTCSRAFRWLVERLPHPNREPLSVNLAELFYDPVLVFGLVKIDPPGLGSERAETQDA